MMYSAYKLNKQGDKIQPWSTPFPIWNQSAVPCPVLTVASWSAHRFLKRQVRLSGIPISWRIFQFVVNHTVKGFGIVNKAEVDVFLELSCFFHNPTAAAATAKLLQSCPTLCDPTDGSPPGSPVPGYSRQEHWSGLPFLSPMHESEKWKWSWSVVSDS